MLVLALIVILYSLSLPALRQPMATHRLRKAADVVRSEWSRTRVRAMRSGRAHAFQFDMTQYNRYRVQPWILPEDVVEAADATLTGFTANTSASERALERIESLPEGIQVASSQNNDTRSWIMATDSNGMNQATEEWSTPPIFFYPDGSSSTAELVLRNEYGNQIKLKMRGLTGQVDVTDVMSEAETEATP